MLRGLGAAASAGAALSVGRALAQDVTSSSASAVLGAQVLTVGPGGQFADPQAAVDAITDSSATRRYVVLLLPGTYMLEDTLRLNGSDAGASGGKDYISFMGIERESCIVSRPTSPGIISPVIQAADHCRIANLTVTSSASRLIPWHTVVW